jgi:hypothetical protein
VDQVDSRRRRWPYVLDLISLGYFLLAVAIALLVVVGGFVTLLVVGIVAAAHGHGDRAAAFLGFSCCAAVSLPAIAPLIFWSWSIVDRTLDALRPLPYNPAAAARQVGGLVRRALISVALFAVGTTIFLGFFFLLQAMFDRL